MTQYHPQPQQHDLDEGLRRLIFAQAAEINGTLLAKLATVADDLDLGSHLAALNALGGIEREIDRMRSFLLLLR